jgi:hypothetical protein
MATRSAILMETKKGHFKGVYCHSDGYFSWNGRILHNHYQDKAKVRKLLSLGFISSLGEFVDIPEGVSHSFEYDQRAPGVTVFYNRDRGDEKKYNKPLNGSLSKVLDSIDHAYAYIFMNNQWYTLFDNIRYYEEEDGFDSSNINEIITVDSLKLIKLSEIKELLEG